MSSKEYFNYLDAVKKITMSPVDQIKHNLSKEELPDLFQHSEVFSVVVLHDKMTSRDSAIKFESCRESDYFKEYVQIYDSGRLVVVYYQVEKDSWRINNYYKLNDKVEIETLGLSIPMSVIYEGVIFSDNND